MTPSRSTLIPILLGTMLVTACRTFPVVPHAVNCEIAPELLTGKCGEPRPIANTTTYAALVDIMQSDRKALRECSITADALRAAITRCNQATAGYNTRIDAINGTK